MAEPLFSVVVPTYGRQRFLDEAVASILAQSIDDLEVIVVDDGSPQPTRVGDDPRVRLVRRPTNGGPGAARNTGVAEARGRYLAFCDDDDLFETDRLALALEGLARRPIAICWGTYLHETDGHGRTLEGDVHGTILDSTVPHLGQTAVERALAPRFNERFRGAEDVEWWLRLSRKGAVTTVPRVGYRVRQHPEQRSGASVTDRIRGRLLLLELYSGYFASHPRAAAFTWKRVGLMARRVGDHRLARKAFRRSLLLRGDAATAWHLARSIRPSSGTVALEDAT